MEKMIKLNKSKIATLLAKKGLTVKMVADSACLAYTTAKHIIQEGRDCVESTSVDKVERLAKALGTSVKAITIGKPYERYPKKAAPAKTGTKSPKELIAKVREKAATKLAESIPKKSAPVKTKKCVTAVIVADPKKLNFDKAAENITKVAKGLKKVADDATKGLKKVGTAIVREPIDIPEAKLPEHIHTDSSVMKKLVELQERITNVHERVAVLIDELIKMNERITKLEKIVLKTSNRKKLVKVE